MYFFYETRPLLGLFLKDLEWSNTCKKVITLERNKDEVMNLIIRRSEITYVFIEIKFTDLSRLSFNGAESNEVWLSECKADNLYTVHDQRYLLL